MLEEGAQGLFYCRSTSEVLSKDMRKLHESAKINLYPMHNKTMWKCDEYALCAFSFLGKLLSSITILISGTKLLWYIMSRVDIWVGIASVTFGKMYLNNIMYGVAHVIPDTWKSL